MHSVTVRRAGISAEQAAGILLRELGAGYHVTPKGPTEIRLRKGLFVRAKILIDHEPGETTFAVTGQGIRLPVPLLFALIRQTNDRGIADRSAQIIAQSKEFGNAV
jgi:hypothetical protein